MAKNIFENFDFNEYHTLLDNALNDGLHLVHNNEGMGGFTFCWRRETDFPKAKMIRVAVSFCSYKDQFCRKIGAYNALANWYNAMDTIMLPVGSPDSAEIVKRLRYIFMNAHWCNS